MVTGLGFDAFRLPQNLGTGQKRFADHKILGPVKSDSPTATSWGRGEAYRIVEETICKPPYRFGRSLGCKMKAQSGKAMMDQRRH